MGERSCWGKRKKEYFQSPQGMDPKRKGPHSYYSRNGILHKLGQSRKDMRKCVDPSQPYPPSSYWCLLFAKVHLQPRGKGILWIGQGRQWCVCGGEGYMVLCDGQYQLSTWQDKPLGMPVRVKWDEKAYPNCGQLHPMGWIKNEIKNEKGAEHQISSLPASWLRIHCEQPSYSPATIPPLTCWTIPSNREPRQALSSSSKLLSFGICHSSKTSVWYGAGTCSKWNRSWPTSRTVIGRFFSV